MFQWQRLLLVIHGLVPGRFFAPLDVDYEVDLSGGGAVDDDIAASADQQEAQRADAEDYIPPDDSESARGGRGDDEHEEVPEGEDDRGARRDVARDRNARDTRGGDRGQQDRGADGARRDRRPNQIPDHRYSRLEQRFDQTVRLLRQQVEQSNRQNRRLRMALDMPERDQPRTFNEKERRIRQQLERTYPELAVLSDARLQKLLTRADLLDRVAEEHPHRGEEEERRWGGHAERMVRSALNHAATQWLGKGKTMADLDEDERDEIDHSFSRWLVRRAGAEEKDLPNGHFGETTLRYEAGDPTLVNEFWTWFTRRHGGAGTGGQRQTTTAAAARADAASRLPRGGSSSAPVGSARREPKKATLDDAVEEAWESVQNARAGA